MYTDQDVANKQYRILTLEQYYDLGANDNPCRHCGALMWKSECTYPSKKNYGLCCKSGRVDIRPPKPPPEPLRSLLNGTHELSKFFRINIRKFNTRLSFASLFAKFDVMAVRGPYTIKLHGPAYHRMGPMLPPLLASTERPYLGKPQGAPQLIIDDE